MDMGQTAMRTLPLISGGSLPIPGPRVDREATVNCVRRSRGDVAGVKVDASSVKWLTVNVGTASCRPRCLTSGGVDGQARRLLWAWCGAEPS